MSDITQAVEQQEIADSILDAPIVGDWLNGTIDDSETDASEHDADLADPLAEPEQEVAEQELPEHQDAQPDEVRTEVAELTPQAIQESIQRLDQAVTELGLNDEASAMRLAQDLTVPFGTNPSDIDSRALGQTMSKAVFSAAQIFEATGGDPNQAPAIPRDSAVAFTNDFLRSWGIDPRVSSVNPEHFAAVMLGGTMNFIQSVNTYGLDASMDRLNTPEAAEAFANAIHRCFGINAPVTRERALAIADAGGRYIVSTLRKLQAHQAQAAPQRATRQSRTAERQSRPTRTRGGQRFQTNQDLFDADTLDFYHRQHGRL